MSRHVTSDEAAELLGIPASAIATWKARRKVIPVAMILGIGHGGRIPVYDLEDLRPLAEKYLERVATRRAKAP